MTDSLVIVFVKNIKLGTVKTRLAKTIGDFGAFEVYSELVKITEKATKTLEVDKRIYFSDAVVDTKWMEHINNMDHLKRGIGLRAYKQQDPVQAYQFEGSEMFDEMIAAINQDTIKYILHITVRKEEPVEREQVAKETSTNQDNTLKKQPLIKEEKVGRNDPCPCGSGKKYKNCHGRN